MRFTCRVACVVLLVAIAPGPVSAQDISPERLTDLNGQMRAGDATASAELHRVAEQGNADAQAALCVYHLDNNPLAPKYEQALTWCTRSASQGNVYALGALGSMYSGGRGVEADPERATDLYLLAAELGEPLSQFHAGAMFRGNRGLGADYVRTYKWFTVFIEHLASGPYSLGREQDHEGHSKVMLQRRAAIEAKMTPGQVVEGQRLAASWSPKTWDQLSPRGAELF